MLSERDEPSEFSPPSRQAQCDPSEGGPVLAQCCAGLENLTNSCYMNSSLVQLANVPPLREYFLSSKYTDTLTVRGLATEKTKGEFAKLFEKLLAEMWCGRRKVLRPSMFKDICGRINDNFRGREQQDSMEFLEFVVDSLKEDCNMVKGSKPLIERAACLNRSHADLALDAANGFVMRNDSFIDDLFVGFMKSGIKCPDSACGHENLNFEAFLSVKLPLASDVAESKRTLESRVVASNSGSITRHTFSIARKGSVLDYINEGARIAGLDSSNCVLAKVEKQSVEFLPNDTEVLSVGASERLALYELTAQAAEIFRQVSLKHGSRFQVGDQIIVTNAFKTANQKSRTALVGMCGEIVKFDADGDAFVDFRDFDKKQWVKSGNFSDLLKLCRHSRRLCPKREEAFTLLEVMAWPEFEDHSEQMLRYWQHEMTVEDNSSENAACIIFLRKERIGSTGLVVDLVGIPLLFCSRRQTTGSALKDAIGTELVHRFGKDFDKWSLYLAKTPEDACDSRTSLPSDDAVLELDEQAYFVVQFGLKEEHIQVLREIQEISEVQFDENTVTLQDCFDLLNATEALGGDNKVTCEGCKKSQHVLFTHNIWTLPPVLVLHLKRFEFSQFGDYYKSNKRVLFPLENLDLTRFSNDVTSFPEGECLRAEREVEIFGLESEKGKLLNGLRGTAKYLDTSTKRFCVRINEEDPFEEWKKVQPKNLKPVPLEEKPEVNPYIYDLASMSKHMGRPGFGHYVAYSRSSEDGLWRLHDDDDIREVKPEVVQAENTGAYVLVYLRRELRPPSWGPPEDS